MTVENLLARALLLSDELSRVSTNDLKAFSGDISQLSRFYRKIEQDLEHRGQWQAGESSVPTTDKEQGSGKECKASRHRNDLKDVLHCSIKNIPCINEAVRTFRQPTEDDPCLRARTVHLQNIVTAQNRRLSIAATSPERILMLCACLSLAKDFYQFELQGGWQPKQTIIVEKIRNKQDVAVQQMGKNVQRYIGSQSTVLASGRDKLYAALRLGIKMAAIDEVGNATGVPCLSLLLGFAYDKTSRLSFSGLQYLQEELKAQPAVLGAARHFGGALSSWWQTCQQEYHARFRDSAAATPELYPASPMCTSPNISPVQAPEPVRRRDCDSENCGIVVDHVRAPPTYITPMLQADWEYTWTSQQMMEMMDGTFSTPCTTASQDANAPDTIVPRFSDSVW